MTDNQDIMEQLTNKNGEYDAGTDQMKFLDILQQSKLKKNGSMKPLKFLNKSVHKTKRPKNKS